MKIKDRIIAALASAPGRSMRYHDLAYCVFPPDKYPRAWRSRAGGGPPGCAMAFGRALREMSESKMIESSYTGRGYTADYTYHLLEGVKEKWSKWGTPGNFVGTEFPKG